ncbi:MAG: allantoinase AllB [Caldiserica bacterium]|jgi:allantoinase|nr:allantoinase AllB [Caldisericota bacterium]MDH7562242.1 allantoinase AllB [Caldisericota bacterium]
MPSLKLNRGILPVKGKLSPGNILIREGKIAALGDLKGVPVDQELDLEGLVVLPGAVDPHVHFDDPGFTWREDFFTGTASAAMGGITTVIDMPETSIPNCRTPEGLLAKLSEIQKKSLVDFALWGGVTGEEVRDGSFREKMQALVSLGVVGFKVYTISGMPTYPRVTYGEMRSIMKEAAKLGVPVGVHAEDFDLVTEETEKARKRGKGNFLDFLSSRPPVSEHLAIASAVLLSQDTGASVHIVHVSTGIGVEIVAEGKNRGIPVTCETCPHYLILTSEDFNIFGAKMKTTPPVRKKWDQEKLWEGLKYGVVDFVSTDHASCNYPEEKEKEDFFEAYAGIPGCQTMLPLIWEEGFVKGRLSLERVLEATGEKASRLFGLYPRKGSLEIGADADLTVLDPRKPYIIKSESLASKGKYTPFEGRIISSTIKMVILRGKIIFQEVEGVSPRTCGTWIKRR